jgi:hypothetical protein
MPFTIAKAYPDTQENGNSALSSADISRTSAAHQPRIEQNTQTLAPNVGKILEEIRKILPQEWLENELNAAQFIKELSRLLEVPESAIEEKSTLLFSENVTFKAGLGLLLEKVARSNPNRKIAVIATNQRERDFIEELNKGKFEDQWIIAVESVLDAWTRLKGRKTYYFKMEGDPKPDIENDNIIVFDITDIVKKIIDAIGKVSGIIERERLEMLHQAVQKFSEAA